MVEPINKVKERYYLLYFRSTQNMIIYLFIINYENMIYRFYLITLLFLFQWMYCLSNISNPQYNTDYTVQERK